MIGKYNEFNFKTNIEPLIYSHPVICIINRHLSKLVSTGQRSLGLIASADQPKMVRPNCILPPNQKRWKPAVFQFGSVNGSNRNSSVLTFVKHFSIPTAQIVDQFLVQIDARFVIDLLHQLYEWFDEWTNWFGCNFGRVAGIERQSTSPNKAIGNWLVFLSWLSLSINASVFMS